MSQFFVKSGGGTPPPAVPTQFTADDGTEGIPAANNLNLLSRESQANNVNGIQTTADPDGGDDFYIELTNRASGTATTATNTTVDVITFVTPDILGVYGFEIVVNVVDTTAPSAPIGATYNIEGSVIADGLGGITVNGIPERSVKGDPTYTANLVDVTASGLNIIVQATGLVGATARWTGLLEYSFGGA